MSDRRYRAILIGNSRFAETQLDDLAGPAHDLPLLAGALADTERGLFTGPDVRRIAERRRVEIEAEIEDFFAEAGYDDVLLFYYSGHGVLNTEGELFLCASDTNLGRLRSTAIGSQWLNATIEDSAARTVVIVLDCCHSGAFKGGDITAPLASGSGRFVLTSSRGAQLSVDTTGTGASAFTGHLISGLGGAAGDGAEITVHELYQYAHRAMAGYGKQEPQFRVTGAGELVISRRIGQPPRASLALSVDAVRFTAPVPADTPPPVTRVYVTGASTFTAESPADWISVTARHGAFDLALAPPPGTHRAFVYVRSGSTTLELPVELTVLPGPQPPGVTGPSGRDTAPATIPDTDLPQDARPMAEAQAAPAAGPASDARARQDAGPATQAAPVGGAASKAQPAVGRATPVPAASSGPSLSGSAASSGPMIGRPDLVALVDQMKHEPLDVPKLRMMPAQQAGRGGAQPGNIPGVVVGELQRAGLGDTLTPTMLRHAGLKKARRNAAVADSELTLAFLPLAGQEAVLFTTVAVYWTDQYSNTAVRYIDFPGRTFTEADGYVSFGPRALRRIGPQAPNLARALNAMAAALRA